MLSSEYSVDKMHPRLRQEVSLQIRDGYKLVSVEETRVRLIKKKNYWFPVWLFFSNAKCNKHNSEFIVFI